MRWFTAVIAGTLVAGLAGLSGCGTAAPSESTLKAKPSSAPRPDLIPGERVGKLAEEQLEAEHLEMAVGKVTCPDLDWKVDASVRCVKVAELTAGRRVKIPGTVTVTSTKGGGTLHVALDDEVAEFGVDGEFLAGDVTDWVTAQTKARPTAVRCGYLRGARGAVTRCSVDLAGKPARVRVSVTDVDADSFRTTYACSWQVRPKKV